MTRLEIRQMRMDLTALEDKVHNLSTEAENNAADLIPQSAVRDMGENSMFLKFLIEAQAQIGNARRNLAFAESMI